MTHPPVGTDNRTVIPKTVCQLRLKLKLGCTAPEPALSEDVSLSFNSRYVPVTHQLSVLMFSIRSWYEAAVYINRVNGVLLQSISLMAVFYSFVCH